MYDKSKSFRIYRIFHTQGDPESMIVGRFLLHEGKFYILEDHDGLFQDFPEDMLDQRHVQLFNSIMHSGYYRIVSENEANEGHHDELIEELDLGDKEPDSEFYLTGQSIQPQRLQYFGNVALLDGQKLTEEELKQIIDKVNLKEYTLEPI